MPNSIDTSIYGNVAQPNMLANMGSMAQTGNLMNQNRLFQQEFKARQAMGPIYQQAIDPVTGKLDTNKLMSAAAQNPDAAFKAGEIAQQALERQGAQTTIQGQELEQALKRQGQVRQTLSALLADPNANPQAAIAASGQLVANGVLSPEQAAQSLASMPQDPQKFQGWLQQNLLQSMDGEQKLQAMYGQTQLVNTGNQMVPMAMSPMAGTRQIGPAINMQMTPGDAASPVEVIGPAGQPGIIPKGDFAGGGGRYPGAAGESGVEGGAPGFMPTALPAGAPKVAEAAAERYNKAVEAATVVPNVVNGYDRALEALDETLSGPGASKAMGIAAVMNTFNIPAGKDATENFQSLRKYLNNASAQAAADAGYSGSDARYEGFGKGQPDVETMNPAALGEAIKYVRAQELGKAARASAMTQFLERSGSDYSALPKWETQWNKAYNPDVMYMRSLDTPEEQARFFSTLPERRANAAKASYPKMIELGAFD